MIYFLVLRCSPSEPLGRAVIGTEKSIPRHLDGLDHHRESYRLDGRYRGPRNPGEWLREAGTYAESFHPPRQMEGGASEYRDLARRFAHLKIADHVFRLGPDLVEFIDANAEDWTGENATAIGVDRPQRQKVQDREAPVAHGLADRLRRRPG